MHILIVEDEPELSEKLQNVLESENYTIDTSPDGEDGLEKIYGENHNLIILDIMLPNLSGLEVLQETRKAGIATPVLNKGSMNHLSSSCQLKFYNCA